MSLGANLLLRTAGEQGKALPLDALISLNNPFDVWLAINLMRGTPYEKYLSYELKNQLVGKIGMPEQEKGVIDELLTKHSIDIEKINSVSTWRDWDECLTSKAFPSYKTVAEYYLAASSLSKIKHIEVPTLVIHSKDDPIVPFECLPTSECLTNPKIIVATVEKGGHVCYF
jgi:predicted alpha/beta-fold hydrolase